MIKYIVWGETLIKKYISNWPNIKEKFDKNTVDFCADMAQNKGDVVYFGIHDLSKKYRDQGFLEKLNLFNVFNKKGNIIDLNKINQTITIKLEKSPFEYGYRKLSKFLKNNKIVVPASDLIDITYMIEDEIIPVYLLIDGSTKYQKNLIKAIRRKELEKSNQPIQPKTRHYDEFDGCVVDIESENLPYNF